LNDFRLNEAKTSLLAGVPIKEVAEQLGYSSVQHFTRAFKEKFGVTPGIVGRKGDYFGKDMLWHSQQPSQFFSESSLHQIYS